MALATLNELDLIANRLAYLLEIDEAGWKNAAKSLDSLALDDGIDLFAEYESPKAWAISVVDRLRSQIDMDRFSDGVRSLDSYETAQDLFWKIFPDWRRTGL